MTSQVDVEELVIPEMELRYFRFLLRVISQWDVTLSPSRVCVIGSASFHEYVIHLWLFSLEIILY